MEYLLDLVRATREHSAVKLGLSSRGGLHLKRAMQATALMYGRDYAVPADLRNVFVPVGIHRIIPASGAGDSQARQRRQDILNRILQAVDAPV
jgi:MoxR-like ATPase